jgi:hypothetical protein
MLGSQAAPRRLTEWLNVNQVNDTDEPAEE